MLIIPKNKRSRKRLITRERLVRLYVTEGLSSRDIAERERTKTTRSKIIYWLRAYGIPRKTPLDGWLKTGGKYGIKDGNDPRIIKAHIALKRKYLLNFKRPTPPEDCGDLAEVDLIAYERQGKRRVMNVDDRFYDRMLDLQPENNINYQRHLEIVNEYRRLQTESGLSCEHYAMLHKSEHVIMRRSLVCVNRYQRRFGWTENKEAKDYGIWKEPLDSYKLAPKCLNPFCSAVFDIKIEDITRMKIEAIRLNKSY